MGKKQELLGRCQNQKNNKQLYVYQLSETGIEIQGGKAGRWTEGISNQIL